MILLFFWKLRSHLNSFSVVLFHHFSTGMVWDLPAYLGIYNASHFKKVDHLNFLFKIPHWLPSLKSPVKTLVTWVSQPHSHVTCLFIMPLWPPALPQGTGSACALHLTCSPTSCIFFWETFPDLVEGLSSLSPGAFSISQCSIYFMVFFNRLFLEKF